MQKQKLTSRHYLKKVKRDLEEIARTPKDDKVRYEKLKRRAEKNLAIAKKLDAEENGN